MEVYEDSSPLTSKKHVYCSPFTLRNNSTYGDEYYITMSTLNPSYTRRLGRVSHCSQLCGHAWCEYLPRKHTMITLFKTHHDNTIQKCAGCKWASSSFTVRFWVKIRTTSGMFCTNFEIKGHIGPTFGWLYMLAYLFIFHSSKSTFPQMSGTIYTKKMENIPFFSYKWQENRKKCCNFLQNCPILIGFSVVDATDFPANDKSERCAHIS